MRELFRALRFGFRLRCPNCIEEHLFRTFFKMHKNCPRCGFTHEREQGYFIGAININQAVTLLLIVGGYLLLEWLIAPGLTIQLTVWALFSLTFPVFFYRYSRGIWMSFDYYISEQSGSKEPPDRQIPEEKN